MLQEQQKLAWNLYIHGIGTGYRRKLQVAWNLARALRNRETREYWKKQLGFKSGVEQQVLEKSR